MGKRQAASEKPRDEENPKIQNLPSAEKTNLKIKFTLKKRNPDGDPVVEPQAVALPYSSAECPNYNIGETSEVHKENGVEERASSKKDEARSGKEKKSNKKVKREEVKMEEVKKEKVKKEKVKMEEVKKEEVKSNKRKKESKEVEEDEVEPGEKTESALYRFPMHRIDRIVRSELSDPRIGPEAVFLINRASEKFLELFCKEAYACAFLDRKKAVSYNHLSSVVSKRNRFDFLADFVPEKVKAEDALKEMAEVGKS